MPSIISIIMIAIAGVCFYIGLANLVSIRSVRRHPQSLLFGLLCLLAGVYFINTLYGYTSINREALIRATRWEETLSLVMAVIILWFLAEYGNLKPRKLLVSLTVIMGILTGVAIVLPLGITWQSIDAVTARTIPWGETVNVLTGTVSPWAFVTYAVYAAIIGFCVAVFQRLYMVNNRRNANYLLVPLTLAIFCFFNDILLNLGLIHSFYLIPYVYIAVILFIGNKLEAGRLRALENYHTLFDAINDAVTVHDAFTGKLLDANSAAIRMFGATRKELLSGDISRTLLMPTIISDHTKKHVLSAHREEPLLVERLFKRQSDGKEFWTETALRSEEIDGSPVILAVTRNIDARKKVEEELEKKQRLESLGILAGGIAHDFNNLLGGIYGHISYARQISKYAEINECLDTTLGTLTRARGLTQQLLTFSRGGTPDLKSAYIQEIVQKAAEFALHGSTTICTFDFSDGLWPCICDANQLAQVIENIVINAHQAMPSTGGRITVIAENVVLEEGGAGSPVAGRYVKIAIADNGGGISREIAGKIFVPFYSTKENGCGLGLATAFSIMKRHGGTIGFDSVPGRGCTFYLYLPAASEPVAATAMPEKRMSKKTGTILVMDDEASVRNAVGLMLKFYGFAVVAVADGDEALDSFDRARNSSSPFIALILDLTIPGKPGGMETIAGIRKRDPDIPVFVYSGYAEDPVIVHPTNYGFTGSIRKPFTSEELVDTLSRHLR